MKLLSVIVPCYNEQETIADFYTEFTKNDEYLLAKDIETEMIFINDGSKDATVCEIKKLIERDKRVHLLSFSRNFGKEAAIYAGLEKSEGDYVVIMDADLQDPPSLLPGMFAGLEEGYESVATRRISRKGEPVIRSFFARMFYRIMRKISKADIVDGARDYRLMTRKFVDAVLKISEYNRFTKGIFGWVGFKTKWIAFENIERQKGQTKWSFWKLLIYSMEGIVGFSTVPLAFASVVGIVFCFLAFIFLTFIFVRALVFGDPVAGWPSTICIVLLVSGVQMFCMGIMGQYMAKTYLEVKRRPIYIVDEMI